ncbi:unnamed protein product [Allacma fusca]|uniref:Peroxisomal membrane protein 11B n=1 Tax=Allacma fusca TaxID=39272 RepID=A0A8J2PQ49_9HEXA|nr:unnamed protein product [Allacma fusca]
MDEFIKFNNQTSGRDKIFRLCQYTSRIVWYSLEKRHGNAAVLQKAKHLDEILGLMRRLLRFGRFYETLHSTFPVMSISDGVIRLTSSLSRIANASFMFLDHVVCLDKLGLLPSKMIEAPKWDLLATKFWLYAILLGLTRDFYDILRIYKEEFQVKFRTSRIREMANSAGTSSSTSTAEIKNLKYRIVNHPNSVVKCVRQVKVISQCVHDHADVAVDTVKNLFDLFIPLNSLGIVKLSPGVIGLLGCLSTVVSVIPQLNPMVKMVPSS